MASPLFFDFEYDGSTIISFGLVSEPVGNGDLSLYVEANITGKPVRSQFVNDSVLPLLEKAQSDKKSLIEIASSIRAFTLMYDDPLFICDSDIDATLLKLLAHDANIHVISFADYTESQVFEDAYIKSFDDVLAPRHHALHDARALRAGYLALEAERSMH